MSDLVKKLRWFASADPRFRPERQHICWQAAKRIEELERALPKPQDITFAKINGNWKEVVYELVEKADKARKGDE